MSTSNDIYISNYIINALQELFSILCNAKKIIHMSLRTFSMQLID